LEDVRLIAYCGIYQFLKQGTSIESFMPLPSDKNKGGYGSNEKMKELIERVKEAHRKRFNLS
jgi:hypothetical protein